MSENPTTLTTCKGIVSYVKHWEPEIVDREGVETLKYSTMFLFSRSNTKFKAAFDKAVKAAFDVGVKRGMFNAKSFNVLKKPLRDGQEEFDAGMKSQEIYQGNYFFNATTLKVAPDLMEVQNGEVVPILNENEFFSGCEARLLINLYPFKVKSSQGIAVGLNGYLKIGEGPRLDGRPSASSAFSKFADEEADSESEFK